MRTHQLIDDRSLALARAIVERIDADTKRRGLEHARAVCERWCGMHETPDIHAWRDILTRDWPDVRRVLLDESEYGQRLRQSSPFCGILSPQERWRIWREFRDHDAGTA